MFNERFNYQALPRQTVNGSRMYSTPSGNLPSVTTILSRTESEEKRQGLAKWRATVGVKKAQEITTEAANRGTRLHSHLENYILNKVEPTQGTNPYSWPSCAMAKVVINEGLKNVDEIWGVEVPLYFPKIYAGTTDTVGIHLGKESIIDYKQTNKRKERKWIEDYFIQTVLYGTAHNELHGTNIRKGVIMMCVKPELDVAMKPISTPEYQEFIIEGAEWEYYEQKMWKRIEEYYLTVFK
jgi:hypothetical protein